MHPKEVSSYRQVHIICGLGAGGLAEVRSSCTTRWSSGSVTGFLGKNYKSLSKFISAVPGSMESTPVSRRPRAVREERRYNFTEYLRKREKDHIRASGPKPFLTVMGITILQVYETKRPHAMLGAVLVSLAIEIAGWG